MSVANTKLNQTAKRKLSRAERKQKRREVTQSQWAREQDDVETDVALPDRVTAFEQHGEFSMAWSTVVQPLLSHFGDADGYVAYRTRWNQTIALGDPVCGSDRIESLLSAFIQQHQQPSFIQVSPATADVLANHNYRINEIGLDTSIHLADYDFKGKHKEWLRYADNWTKRRGFEVRECSFSEVRDVDVEAVSEAWRKTRTVKRKEVRFLNRPIVLQDEPNVRKFFLFDADGNINAFVFLDPLFRDGTICGYVTSIKRRLPDAPIYSEQAIMKRIIETLKAEGIEQLKLGLSPCASVDRSGYRESVWIQKLFQWAFNSKLVNRRAYNLTGHASYKSRFRGTEEKVYLASPPGIHPRRLPALIAMCGIA
ncbi:phosphatidylglycerol lysyltransferase domain-containing protein [Mariniblastus fucicola]|uniref:Phosphatidylglycerol lysyltransferase n=1 Tax=Mariniblastus fucicola TaxID=980251 RepID=A0A5B9P5T5_9BACT|nr:phosphatidylglycerol lysyltransferase domain-containing protein [Mariniblastus fucicola]QEG20342.1 Phosphatidylglycerol lysyltransferase [Mariniblastus fucicola]